MKREIKFRAQKKFTGNINQLGWVYGLPRHFENVWYMHTLLNKVFPIDPETLSQYTGFKDKNGKEVYEGDIIRHYDDSQYYIGVVGWHEWGYLDITNKLLFADKFNFEKFSEIIGNIYDNPELLKPQK